MTTTEIMNLADTYADGPHTEGYYGVHRAALLSAIEALVRDAEGTGFVDVYRDAKRYRWLRTRVGVSFDTSYPSVWLPTGRSKIDIGDEMKTDAAIDLARAEQKEPA